MSLDEAQPGIPDWKKKKTKKERKNKERMKERNILKKKNVHWPLMLYRSL